MADVLKYLLRWSEVWPMIIPMTIFLIYGIREKILTTVVIYAFAVFVLSGLATCTVYYKPQLPAWLQNNNILYNTISVLRTLLIGWYIIRIPQLKVYRYTKIIFLVYIAALLINFICFENPVNFSIRVFAAESIVLLIFCLTYFLGSILDEDVQMTLMQPEFLLCAGVSLYEAMNFFIYLFFFPVFETNPQFGFSTMKVSKYSNIFLGIILGIALYQSYRRWKNQINLTQKSAA